MVSSEDTGRDFEHCVRLQKKMKEFDQDLAVEAARVETINKLAEKLVSQGHAGSADITNRQQALNERWNRLQDRASERRQQLAEACEMHAFDRDCKDVSDLINEKVSLLYHLSVFICTCSCLKKLQCSMKTLKAKASCQPVNIHP